MCWWRTASGSLTFAVPISLSLFLSAAVMRHRVIWPSRRAGIRRCDLLVALPGVVCSPRPPCPHRSVMLLRLHIDDPVDAFAIHAGGGSTGVFVRPPNGLVLACRPARINMQNIMRAFMSMLDSWCHQRRARVAFDRFTHAPLAVSVSSVSWSEYVAPSCRHHAAASLSYACWS